VTMGADVSSTPTASTLGSDECRVREADGEADAYYLQRLWHHWFGAEYDSNETLQTDLFDIAGWSLPDDADDAPRDAFGVIAEHRRDDHAVRIGGAIVALYDHETAVEELPDGDFDADALAGETNAWLLLSVVDQEWRGRGIGSELLARRLACSPLPEVTAGECSAVIHLPDGEDAPSAGDGGPARVRRRYRPRVGRH